MDFNSVNLITLMVSVILLAIIYYKRQELMMRPNGSIIMLIIYTIALILFLDGVGLISIMDTLNDVLGA